MSAQSQHPPPSPQPRDYFSRREQYRLMMMVFALMLVLVLIREAAKTENWQWMFGNQPSENTAVAESEIDTRRAEQIDNAPLAEGVFVSPAQLVGTEDDLQLGALPALRGIPTTDELAAVRDDTVFRGGESAAWYKLLALLQETSTEELRSYSLGNVGFAQLYRSPRTFRGQVVEIEGDVRRAHYLEAPENHYGVPGYWQCWVFPTRSQNPMVVYALQLPPDFPSGMQLTERIKTTGIFFKRWAYSSASGSRVAPLLVANTIDWQRGESRSVPALNSRMAAIVVIGCGLLAIGIAGYTYRRSNVTLVAPRGEAGTDAKNSSNTVQLDAQQRRSVVSAGDFLDKLSDELADEGPDA